MKKIIFTISIFTFLIFNACEEIESEFLEAPAQSTLDESVIFSTPGLARGAINGIMEPFGQTNSYRGRYIPFYGFNTDTEWNYSSNSPGNSQAELMIYDAKPNNGQMNSTNNVWAMMYTGIERANIAIRGLREFGNPEPGNELGQLLGEALTLRAIYYADLIKTWSDVPMRFEPITAETLFLGKTSRDILYKQIIADLGEAATLVAWPNETSATASVERINKAFVKGLRARVALAAAGWQQYPDGVRRSNDPALSVQNMYTLAFNEVTDVIESGRAFLEPSYETLWRKLNEENTTAGGESLWEIPFADGRGRVLFSFAVRHRGVDQHTAQPRGGIAGPLATVFYDYDEADIRRDITCIPYQYGNPDASGFARQELQNLETWYFGKYRYEWMNRRVTSSNDDGINKIYMRYAEILLMAAETANELQGPGAAAPYLKEIRRRAFPPELHQEKVENYVNAIGSSQDMLNAIIDEHKFEFTGEMERKQALIRWNRLGSNLTEAKQKLFDLKNRTGQYTDVPTTLFFRYLSDGETLDIIGLNRGETADPGPEFSAFDWTNINDDLIDALFKPGVNPDDRQFWPIWQVFLDASNGLLINDYGY